jgi:hypothetical protein
MNYLPDFEEILARDFRFVIYSAEEDANSTEPGPIRIQVFKFPTVPQEMIIVASGATLSAALQDLSDGIANGALDIVGQDAALFEKKDPQSEEALYRQLHADGLLSFETLCEKTGANYEEEIERLRAEAPIIP